MFNVMKFLSHFFFTSFLSFCLLAVFQLGAVAGTPKATLTKHASTFVSAKGVDAKAVHEAHDALVANYLQADGLTFMITADVLEFPPEGGTLSVNMRVSVLTQASMLIPILLTKERLIG